MNNLAKFEFDNYYHVYNRTNNNEILFKNNANKYYFLAKFRQYLSDYVNTYAYCLLQDHFHFLIQVKSESEIDTLLKRIPLIHRTNSQIKFLQALDKLEVSHLLIEKQFTRLFTSYSMGFNKLWSRKGNLFYRPFKRKEAESEFHLLGLMLYIHHNPIHHNLSNSFSDYKWSSYNTVLSNSSTLIKRDEILTWFGGTEEYKNYHREYREFRSGNAFG